MLMKKITKLMLTLALLLVGVTGANAEIVEKTDVEVDFSQFADGDASTIRFYGWGASDEAKARLSIKDGCLHFHSTEATTNSWDAQFFPIGGVMADEGVTYTLHFKVKGTINKNISALGFGQNPYGQFPITTEWVEGTFDYTATGANPSGDILFQCGDYVGDWDIAYLKITHKEDTAAPTVNWTTIIDNDARCIRSKEYPDGNILPAKINNGEFVVNAPAKVEQTWESQIWFRLPQTLAAGKKFRVSFDYRASAAVKAETQSHNEPGQYIIWYCIGDVNFTTEWQEFSNTVKVPAECTGGDNAFRTIAFNLSQTEAVDFYFRNIKVEIDENDVTEPDYPADVYTIAGTADLCGVAWDTRSNVMTLNSKTGLYVKTFENVAINSDSYPEFKVVKNCSWSTAWPSSNYVIETDASGKYNITITYNPETNEVDVNAVATLTAAGNNTTLFGESTWDPTITANDLTKNTDGTYSIKYENKDLSAGTIEFKIVRDHSWDVASYPEENYQLNIPRSSNYDVTITFYPENKDVVATLKDNEAISSYYLVGGIGSDAWSLSSTPLAGKSDVYSVEIPYVSTYSFAIAPNTALNDDKNAVVVWDALIRPTETTSVDFENVSGVVSTTDNGQKWSMVEIGNGEEKEFKALFTYDSTDGTWEITASTTTTIGETGFATYSNAKPYTVEGATANFITISTPYAKLAPLAADAILPAMTGAGKHAGVILSGAAGEVTINAVAKGAEATATGIENNLLAGSGNYSYGISTQFADNDPYTAYIFAQPEGKKLGFYIADLSSDDKLAAHKAFLAVPQGADAREFIGFEPGETTSIADNNRVTTTNNGEVYNLNGQRVAQPTKGLYIVNGKKYVVK